MITKGAFQEETLRCQMAIPARVHLPLSLYPPTPTSAPSLAYPVADPLRNAAESLPKEEARTTYVHQCFEAG